MKSQISRKFAEEGYKSQGLEVDSGFDEAGKVYTPHRHEKTWLTTISGSLRLKLGDSDWVTLEAGQEAIVGGGQLHEAVVGDEGWEYVAGWDAEEAKRYEH